jgi:hypothetical protein
MKYSLLNGKKGIPLQRYYLWLLLLAGNGAYCFELPRTELRFAPATFLDASYKGAVTNHEKIPSVSIKITAPHYSWWTYGGVATIGMGGRENGKAKSTLGSLSLSNGLRFQRWNFAIEAAGLYGLQQIILGEGPAYGSSYVGRIRNEEEVRNTDARYVYIDSMSSIFGVHGGAEITVSYRFNNWVTLLVGGNYVRHFSWQKSYITIDRSSDSTPADEPLTEKKSIYSRLVVDTRAVYFGLATSFF